MADEYRVVTDGVLFWVKAVRMTAAGFELAGHGPKGEGREALMADWVGFNMALHKPVLDAATGHEVSGPLVGKRLRTVDGSVRK